MTKFLMMLSVCAVAVGCNLCGDDSKRAGADAAAKPQMAQIDARKTLTYLASDQLEGRGIGTAGIDRAADFIAAAFREIGLQKLPGLDGFFQPFEMTTATEVGPKTSLKIADRSFQSGEDFSPLSFSGEGSFAGPVVFVGYAMKNDAHHYDDFAGIDLKGKVALAMRYEPHDEKGNSQFEKDGWSDAAALSTKASAAKDAGAVALILVTPTEFHAGDNRLVPFARRPMTEGAMIPVLHVRHTVAEEILKRGGAPDLKSVQAKIDQSGKPASFALAGVEASGNVELKRSRVTVKNVAGLLPGKIRDEYVVVGAHYDHLGRGGLSSLNPKKQEIHNGADDNASGTTALLELAAKFARGPTPERSIIFVAFTAEEEGCIGSKYFVDHPPVPLERMTAMINLDMVGRIRSTPSGTVATTSESTSKESAGAGILYVSGSGTAKAFEAIIKEADEQSGLVARDIGKGGLGPSDHMSFALKRVPVLFFFSGLHGDYHRPTDDAEKINFDGIGDVVGFTAHVISAIAKLPRQEYIVAADAHSMKVGSPSGGSRVTLGIIPDYITAEASNGVRISGTTPDSPAAKAGLRDGDTIVGWNEKKVESLYELSDLLARAKAGDQVKLKVLRDKATIEMTATLAPRG